MFSWWSKTFTSQHSPEKIEVCCGHDRGPLQFWNWLPTKNQHINLSLWNKDFFLISSWGRLNTNCLYLHRTINSNWFDFFYFQHRYLWDIKPMRRVKMRGKLVRNLLPQAGAKLWEEKHSLPNHKNTSNEINILTLSSFFSNIYKFTTMGNSNCSYDYH